MLNVILSCFRVTKASSVAPANWSSSILVSNTAPKLQSQTSSRSVVDVNGEDIHCLVQVFNEANDSQRQRSLAVRCACCLDGILCSLLVDARLEPYSSGSHTSIGLSSTGVTASQLPSTLATLHQQLVHTCDSRKTVSTTARTDAIWHLTQCLLKFCKQQQEQWSAASAAADCVSPAANTLVNLMSILLFSKVSLDPVEALHIRHEQCSGLLASIGLSLASLAACVQPVSKAVLAHVMLGGKATAGDSKVCLVVVKSSAFWDTLQQLQQQGMVPSVGKQHRSNSLQRAKLFPRFVHDSIYSQQHHHLWQQATKATAVGDAINSDRHAGLSTEGGEGHGPRKEFFELVAEGWTRAIDSQRPALFVHMRTAGSWWFNTMLQPSPHLQAAFWAVGWILGQAMVNRATLGLQLAPLLFHRLVQPIKTGVEASFAMLEQHDPDAAQGMATVIDMPQQQYQQLLQLEGQPVNMSRQDYVNRAVYQLLVHDVAWQFQALRQGFYTVMDQQVLLDCCFDGQSLAAAICGQSASTDEDGFHIRKAFRVILEDEAGELNGNAAAAAAAAAGMGQDQQGSGQSHVLILTTVDMTIQCLWCVLDSCTHQQKRAFLKFVTGSDRLPPPGSEQLTLSFPFVATGIKQHQQLLGTLPQSHTCANTLELPNYAESLLATESQLGEEWTAAAALGVGCQSSHSSIRRLENCHGLFQRCCQLMKDRMLIAIANCQSYELDEEAPETDAAVTTQPIFAPTYQSLVKMSLQATDGSAGSAGSSSGLHLPKQVMVTGADISRCVAVDYCAAQQTAAPASQPATAVLSTGGKCANAAVSGTEQPQCSAEWCNQPEVICSAAAQLQAAARLPPSLPERHYAAQDDQEHCSSVRQQQLCVSAGSADPPVVPMSSAVMHKLLTEADEDLMNEILDGALSKSV